MVRFVTVVGLAGAFLLLRPPPSPASTFTVTTPADRGPGSLRQAIVDVNAAAPGPHTIAFAIPGPGPHTIIPDTALPPITHESVTIDGSTQPGYSGSPIVEIRGEVLGGTCLDLVGSAATLRALSVTDCERAIDVQGAGASIFDSYVGLAPDGSIPRQSGIGIFVQANDVTIGGARDGNVLSGSSNPVWSVDVTGLEVYGNLVGTTPDGTAAAGESGSMVMNGSGARIGGPSAGLRNVISGSDGVGLSLGGSGGHIVQGNYIGTDVTGTRPVPNRTGVYVSSPANLVGGTTAAAGNVISGNADYGMRSARTVSGRNRIVGNRIGTDPTGSVAIPNRVGIGIGDNTDLGEPGAEPNVVSGNLETGIEVVGQPTIANNRIGTDRNGRAALGNGGVGIGGSPGGGGMSGTIGGTMTGTGNVISGNQLGGIQCTRCTGLWVLGNVIGTDVTGTVAVPNRGPGVTLTGVGNRIGGTSTAARNVISGNGSHGITIDGTAPTIGTIVSGNHIGTTRAGNAALPNQGDGIMIVNAGHTTIGGTASGAKNVISGNARHGISLFGLTDDTTIPDAFTTIERNHIGVDRTGTAALVNGGSGISGWVSADAVGDGRVQAIRSNTVSGNRGFGIDVSGGTGTRLQIVGNRVGTSADGMARIANGSSGIRVQEADVGIPGAGNVVSGNAVDGIVAIRGTIAGNLVGLAADGVTPMGNGDDGIDARGSAIIGGATTGAANTIAHNRDDGIAVPARNSWMSAAANSIFDNGGLGIDLGPNGPTANDLGDGDTGANGLLNFPVLRHVFATGGNLEVEGWIDVPAATPLRIDLYTVPVGDPSRFGEGRTFLGSTTLTADNLVGPQLFATTLAASLPAGSLVTATATDTATVGATTSEFSEQTTVLTRLMETEPNDTTAAPMGVTIGAAPVVVTGSTWAGSVEVDTYRFNAPAGARLSAVLDTHIFDVATFRLEVVGPDGATVVARDGGDGTRTALGPTFVGGRGQPGVANVLLPTSGAYFLRVVGDPDFTVHYTLVAATTSTRVASEVQPNGSPVEATPLLTFSAAAAYQRGTLDSPDDVDVYSIEATAGQVVLIGGDEDPNGNGDTNLMLEVANATATVMTIDMAASPARNEVAAWVPATSERYFLTVRSATDMGEYRLHVATSAKPVSMAISDVSISEGQSGPRSMTFRVALGAIPARTVTVQYATAPGTATSPSDFSAVSGTLAFLPGERSKTFTVAVATDTVLEPDETFTVALASPVNAYLADGTAVGTIRNDD